ncbi:MAG: hypothetical protein II453_20730, partial [Alphaproteobacteria bacterium]|nr:hypothetical protein [Alphaproteobacteria bacterium]
MNFCIFKGVLTLAFGNVLVLSAFASGSDINDFSEKNNTVKVKLELEKAKSEISEKFKNHIKNLKNNPSLELDQDSIESILTEITNSMLDIDPYKKSARYSDGRTILEFYEDEGFEPIDKYLGENWSYVVLMNLLQNMKNGDIEVIKDDEQKTELMNKVVMDIRNAYIRKASSHDYDDTQCVNELNKAGDIVKQYFDILNLWNFVLQIKQKYYKPESTIQKVKLEKAKSKISEKFKNHIKNLKNNPSLELDQDSIESILTEITNSMLDI